MKKKIYLIIISVLFLAPVAGLAEDINISNLLNEIMSNEQATSPNITVTKFDLSWSPDTYTPIEYIGRALPAPGSKVLIEASVNVANGDAKNLKYSWFLDDIFQKNKSGYGKNSFYFYAKSISGRSHVIRVQVFNEDRTIFQEKTIEIPIVSPEVVLIRQNTNNLSIIAKPYFFSINKLTDLKFDWMFEGQIPISSSDYGASVLDINIINRNNNESVKKELIVNVRNLKDTNQRAYKSIKINL